MECESLRVLHGNFIRETQLLDLFDFMFHGILCL